MIVNKDNFDLSKVKLIIWDLDNTFWDGTLAEEGCQPINKNIELVKELSKRGIVNSICSKNDYTVCKERLEQYGCWEYFVFPSIDWTFKGNRVRGIINDMALRPINVLFLDDEPLNLQNVLAIDNNIMCSSAQEITDIIWQKINTLPYDESCPRLKQYKVLEVKHEAQKQFDSNDAFLREANIQIIISHECNTKKDRLLDLINRSNQLNYTKIRLTSEQLDILLSDERFDCRYIECVDKYGEYGIIGFYALNIKTNTLDHFVFSCRTLGMGIEQYIYAILGFPAITISGKVANQLNNSDCPDWINEVNSFSKIRYESGSEDEIPILLKGPCDISQIIPFFATDTKFEEECTYVSQTINNLSIEGHNHSTQLLLTERLSDEEKEWMINDLPFIDEEYFNTNIFNKKYKCIVISMLVDYGLGLYQYKKNPKYIVPFGQYTIDATDRKNWKEIKTAFPTFTEERLELFRQEWRYIGRITSNEIVNNFKYILGKIDKETKLVLIGGAEKPFHGYTEEALNNRHLVHKEYNSVVKRFCEDNTDRCLFVDVNDFIPDASYYMDTINHYKKSVYYEIANKLKEYINQNYKNGGIQLKGTEYLKQANKEQQIWLIKRKTKRTIQRILKKIGIIIK